MLGFLPDDQAAQVVSRRSKPTTTPKPSGARPNYILLDADRARLQSVYDGLQADLAKWLDPVAWDELQLRAQQSYLVVNDLHFDGVSLTGAELRNLVRASKSFQDLARNEFVPARPRPEAEQNAQAAGFTARVKQLLGAEQFADYQRAQDADFREIFAFSQQNHLPQTAAIAVYDSRQAATRQAAEIQGDASLSDDERATAFAVLTAAAQKSCFQVAAWQFSRLSGGTGPLARNARAAGTKPGPMKPRRIIALSLAASLALNVALAAAIFLSPKKIAPPALAAVAAPSAAETSAPAAPLATSAPPARWLRWDQIAADDLKHVSRQFARHRLPGIDGAGNHPRRDQ